MLVYRNGVMPLGLLSFCLAYGQQENHPIGGIFTAIREGFARFRNQALNHMVEEIRDFRNTYVAHQEKELTDRETARAALIRWIDGLLRIYRLHNAVDRTKYRPQMVNSPKRVL